MKDRGKLPEITATCGNDSDRASDGSATAGQPRFVMGQMAPLGACRELAPSKQESTTYEPSLVCKLLILGCRLLIPDRLLGCRWAI